MEEGGMFGAMFGCCCGGAGFGEELYKDWDSHPACRQYAIIKRLGEGGFAEVHLAEDKLTGKAVALKVVFLNKTGLTKEQRSILAGEARLVRMVAHPNIVRCLQVLETRRQQVLVLEHLSGGEMLRQLQRMKRYSEANACQMFKQVADAVAYLHSLSILHRDIKPENCLLDKPASHYAAKNRPVKVKLIDLGMAGLYRPNKPRQGCMGSPGFIAPEVILGEAHTPAMDVYSLGVLLFVMLVGRKPWDAQRSHTLAYAVQPTCEAPGLGDPVYINLSTPAKQLLLWMLAEDPSRRPTAQQLLGHSWVLQGGCCKPDGSSTSHSTAAAAAAPSRVYQQVVQQRLQVLSRSRDIMGTARGMMVMHGSGSRSQAVMFHKAVKAARLQLQQQATALQAAGQMPAVGGAGGAASFSQQQPEAAAGPVAASNARHSTVSVSASEDVSPSAAESESAALSRSSAPVSAAAATASRGLPRTASDAAIAATAAMAAEDAAAGEPPATSRLKPVTVGQLAREDILRRHSLLFGALQQQQQQQPQPPPLQQQQQHIGSRPRGVSTPGTGPAVGSRPRHRTAASEGGAAFSSAVYSTLDAAAAAAVPVDTATAGAATPARAIAMDVHHCHVGALERGMSAPNEDVLPFSPPTVADRAMVGPRRLEWAVSMSPGALALLDADDQLCLINAAGMSVEEEDTSLLAAGVLSWGRRGAADMVASFKERYPMKPIARSFARFGQSLSRSLGRSIKSPGHLSNAASGSGQYMDAAAAGAAADTQSEPPTDAENAANAAAAAEHEGHEQLGRMAQPVATSDLGHAAARPASTSAAGPDPVLLSAAAGAVERAGDAAAPPQPHVVTMAAGSSTSRLQQRQPQLSQQQRQQQLHARPGSPTAQPRVANLAQLVPRQPSEPGPVPHGSVDHRVGSLGLVFSMEGSQSLAMWEMSMGVLSGNSSMRCSTSDVSTLCPMGHALHDDEDPQQQQHEDAHGHIHDLNQQRESLQAAAPHYQQQQAAGAGAFGTVSCPTPASAAGGGGTVPVTQAPAAAMVAADASGVVGSEGTMRDLARVSGGSAASSGSRVPSAFATSSGIAAAAAAALDRSSTGYRSSGSSISLSRPSMHASSVRAAATAAAARAEEEGINLPNGLWLQQSQSLKGGTVAAALQLLGQGLAAAGADNAVGLEEAGSGGLLPAGSSRTLSGPLSPALTQSDSLAAAGQVLLSSPAAAGAATATDSSICIGAGHVADVEALGPGNGAVEAAENDVYSMTHPVLQPTHARNVSMMSWLPGAEALAAGAPAADAISSSTLGQSTLVPQQQMLLTSARPGAGDGEARLVPGAIQSTAAGASRAVTVPLGAAAGHSQRSRPSQPWLSPARHGSSSITARKQKHTGSGGAVLQLAAFHGPSGAAPAAAASGGGGVSALEHAPSAAASSVEQEFYVGSFWSPGGLAAQAGVRRQQLQLQRGASGQLARSTSSLGRLDSLQDSGLLVGAASTALELDDATSALQQPGGSSTHTPVRAGAGPAAGQVGGSSGTRSGYGTRGEYRVSTEGLLEGCLPADSSESHWEGGGPVSPQQAHAAVLVRVQSGLAGPKLEGNCGVPAVAQQVAYLAAAQECIAGGSAKSSSKNIPEQPGATGDSVLAGGTASNAGISAELGIAAFPGKYSWIAKELVSRSQQQREHQPWFDAFDEPRSGEWYFPDA